MLTRRSLPLLAAASLPTLFHARSAAAAALPIPPGNVINSKVIRNNSEIGTARYVFEPSGDDLRVLISMDLAIKVGPITMFRYTHRNTETWKGGELYSLDSTTNDDGTARFCHATRTGDGFAVRSSKDGSYVAPGNALGTTYWNMKTISVPLINTEDGHLLNIRMTPQGNKTFPLGNGGSVATREWEMTGDLHVELYYEADGRWAGMNYYAKDKSLVHYLRV